MARGKESHLFYPVLFSFRLCEEYDSVSRSTVPTPDATSLIRSALDDPEYAWLTESAAVEELWRASLVLVAALDRNLLPVGQADPEQPPTDEVRTRRHWRYAAALARLRAAGIRTVADERAGADAYSPTPAANASPAAC